MTWIGQTGRDQLPQRIDDLQIEGQHVTHPR